MLFPLCNYLSNYTLTLVTQTRKIFFFFIIKNNIIYYTTMTSTTGYLSMVPFEIVPFILEIICVNCVALHSLFQFFKAYIL